MRSKTIPLVAILTSAILAGPLSAAPAPKGEVKADRTAAEMIRKALDTTGKFEFTSVPLSKAVRDLATRYGVNVVIDPRTVKTKAADNPVTLQVDDVPFESAIRLLCEMADLKPARMGNVIFVTTEARADKLRDGDSLVP